MESLKLPLSLCYRKEMPQPNLFGHFNVGHVSRSLRLSSDALLASCRRQDFLPSQRESWSSTSWCKTFFRIPPWRTNERRETTRKYTSFSFLPFLPHLQLIFLLPLCLLFLVFLLLSSFSCISSSSFSTEALQQAPIPPIWRSWWSASRPHHSPSSS